MKHISLDNVIIVLYQTQDVVNIGGVVRAMSNFGLTNLRLVQPVVFDPYRIEGIAHHTEFVIEKIRLMDSLEEAIADCSLVLATTARRRGTERDYFAPRQAAPYILQAVNTNPENKVALLFGREDDGLPNFAIDLAHACITIPTSPLNSSLNLAQAVLLIGYELWLNSQGEATISLENPLLKDRQHATTLDALVATLAEDAEIATGAEREHLFKALAGLLLALYPTTTEQRMIFSVARLRAILMRAVPHREESRLLAHLFEHLTQVVKSRGQRSGDRG
jgi:TrmH family RNA methyltransferase